MLRNTIASAPRCIPDKSRAPAVLAGAKNLTCLIDSSSSNRAKPKIFNFNSTSFSDANRRNLQPMCNLDRNLDIPPPLGLPLSAHIEAISRGLIFSWLLGHSFSYCAEGIQTKNVVSNTVCPDHLLDPISPHLDPSMSWNINYHHQLRKAFFFFLPHCGAEQRSGWGWVDRQALMFSRVENIR